MVGANLAITSGILSGSILLDLEIVACRAAASSYDTIVQVRLRQSLWQEQCSSISAGDMSGAVAGFQHSGTLRGVLVRA